MFEKNSQTLSNITFYFFVIKFSMKGSATDIAWTLRDSISSAPPCLAFAVGSLDGTVLFVQLGEGRREQGRERKGRIENSEEGY